MKKIVFIIAFITASLSLMFVQLTEAVLTDSAASTNNTFSTASEFPPEPPLTHMVLNEIFQATDNPQEWVEVHNPTNSSIDVSGWGISDNFSSDTFPTVSPIPAGGYGVIVTNATTVTPPPSAVTIVIGNATIAGSLAGSGDKVVLHDDLNAVVDTMSYGTDTSVFPIPVPSPGVGESLSRMPNGSIDTDTSLDWQQDSTPTLGTANN